jgi:hypothetical protein
MHQNAVRMQKVTWVNLQYPMSTLGSRRERTGQRETRHLKHFV